MAAFGNMLNAMPGRGVGQAPTVGPPRPQTVSAVPAPVPNPISQAPTMQAPAGGPGVSPVNSATAPAPMAPPPAPSAPVSPVSSAPAGSSTSSFGPGNDLLSTQINPNMPVNRTQLAQNTIASWDAQHAPELAAQQRTIGQNAAKFGRIGAGMTTNDLTGAEATYNRDRMGFQNQLASGLADSTVNDAANANNQLRAERDYQTGRSDKATSDAVAQKQLEDQLLNSSFGRALTRTNTGFGSSPVDTLSQFSGTLGQSGDASTAAGIGLMSGANKPPAPTDWASILKAAQGGTAPVTTPPRTGVVRNY